jgi:hypothetical protein
MSKQDHNKSFVIKVFIVCEGAHKIIVGFSTSVNSICGSQDNYGQLMTHSQLLEGLKCESKCKVAEEEGVGARSLAHNT